MGVESLNQYLDKDPLPSKVRVFFKAKTKLDSLRSLVSDLEGSMYVKHITFDVQNWMVFQGRVWFLDCFSPVAWFVILLFSWINISLCIEKCFVSSQWLTYWRRMGASYHRIRLQIILTLLFLPMCLYALLWINPLQNLFAKALSHYGHNLKYAIWQSYMIYSLCYQILLVILAALINISFRKMTNN